ncbi:hypothetical protein L596_026605 [Steinernema carpocapsae]|uniref:Peptidase A2 domain-containing protein n=1 Tax=Steinernema carpocapsae TaxID=34508 RepID=A0A4U5M1V4_STECR|nr:hypothetical protein L596_026605 [Steinernema carpocapsae]
MGWDLLARLCGTSPISWYPHERTIEIGPHHTLPMLDAPEPYEEPLQPLQSTEAQEPSEPWTPSIDDKRFWFYTTLGDQRIRALFDTGASRSYLRMAALPRDVQLTHSLVPNVDTWLGRPLPVLGEAAITCALFSAPVSFNVLILDPIFADADLILSPSTLHALQLQLHVWL